jgi:hypothetical protein
MHVRVGHLNEDLLNETSIYQSTPVKIIIVLENEKEKKVNYLRSDLITVREHRNMAPP